MKFKSRKNKFVICSILVLIILVSACNIYAARYDIENFPVSKKSDVFPDDYKPYIDALKKEHPSWIFKAVYTGLDWNEALSHESYEVKEGVSLVPDYIKDIWKKDGQNYYKDGNFVIAAKDAVAYMLDPRTHLNEEEIFQFETLNFSEAAHSKEAVEKVLYGTSMYNENRYKKNGQMINMDKQYSDIIVQVAKQCNVSATFIASRIIQETGGDIIGYASINGSFSGYEGYYNFFNIGATPPNALTNGLIKAKNSGWTTPEIAIFEGTKIIKKNWIDWGQNTTYFQKFDVNNEGKAVGLYAYQYMTNILAPTNESKMTYSSYKKINKLNDAFEFYIPVYENRTRNPVFYPGTKLVDDNTRIKADNLNGGVLNIRSGSTNTSPVIAKLKQDEQMTRIGKSTIDQWDYIKLDNGLIGYAFRDYTTELSNVKVESVSLNVNKLVLNERTTSTLVAKVLPEYVVNKAVTWQSSNTDIATVDANGVVTAKKAGQAVITAKTVDGGKTATCDVTVKYVKIDVEKISVEKLKYQIKKDEKVIINPVILPENASNKEYSVEIKDNTIVKYENNAFVGLKSGETVIKFISKDNTSKYIETKIKVFDINAGDILIDDTLVIDSTGKYISKVNTSLKLKNFKDKIITNFNVKYLDMNGKELGLEDCIGTGTKIVISDGTKVIKEYTLVIYGDLSGDGEIDTLDLLLVQKYILELKKFNKEQLIAGNITRDGDLPSTLDLLKIQKHILNISQIKQ